MTASAVEDSRVATALRWGQKLLNEAGCDSPRLDAELLLEEATRLDRVRFILEPERRISPEESERFEALIRRRRAREPVAYLLGRKGFWTFELEVGPGVLVPRPETELLVEQAVRRLRGRSSLTIVDLGCGAAPISAALALELRPARMVAVDRSPLALAYARRNLERLGLAEKVSLLAGDLFEPLAGLRGGVDLIASNPPYIPSLDVEATMPEVEAYEPRLALDGGPTGLEISERILVQARDWLSPSGSVALETGAGLMPRLVALAERLGFRGVEVLRDLAGIERVLWAQKEEA